MKLQSSLSGTALLACAALFLGGCADSSPSSNTSSSSGANSSSGASSGSSGASGSSSGGSSSCKPGTTGCQVVIECPAGTTFKPFVNATASGTEFVASMAQSGLCLGCSVSNTNNVVDPTTTSPATISLPVGLLNGDASITVEDTTTTYPSGDLVGFIVSVPGAAVLNLALLQPITVTSVDITSTSSTDVTAAGSTRPVSLDLLSLLANNGQSVATVTSTGAFNAVRLDVGGVANALTNIDVYAAGVCVAQ